MSTDSIDRKASYHEKESSSEATANEIRLADVEKGAPTLPHDSQDTIFKNELEDNSNVPRLSLPYILWFFLTRFGIFAWGGPVASIGLIKDRLVVKDKWITMARFNRVFAVYQILPGPEATELCMFFGCLCGGRLGGLMAGLGFILPGFVLMLAASYLYVVVGFSNVYVNGSFRALQPMVAAMVCDSRLKTLLAKSMSYVLLSMIDFSGYAQDSRSRLYHSWKEVESMAYSIRLFHYGE